MTWPQFLFVSVEPDASTEAHSGKQQRMPHGQGHGNQETKEGARGSEATRK
jgi:hypothetical protein